MAGAQEAEAPRGGPRRNSILLVEDDGDLAEEIVADLAARGYKAVHAADGLTAMAAVLLGSFDLLIVDQLLPGLDGIGLIQRMRDENFHVPVVLSALSAVDERVRGLKAGGDDYLTKPFAFSELAARIEALLRPPLETRRRRFNSAT